jgi:RNA polymerase sigma-70 factor (ECF subfamily)
MADVDQQARTLLLDIAGRDQPSLEAFYALFETTVYRFALSRLNDSHAASDILNEVMMEVWKSAGRFKGQSRVSTWLLGITLHKVIDHDRKQTRHKAQELDENVIANMVDNSDIDHAQVMVGVQDAEALQQCVQGLPDNHREVIHLAFFEDLGYEEIAAIVECPLGTVKSRVYHAKSMLKKCLSSVAGGMVNYP